MFLEITEVLLSSVVCYTAHLAWCPKMQIIVMTHWDVFSGMLSKAEMLSYDGNQFQNEKWEGVDSQEI